MSYLHSLEDVASLVKLLWLISHDCVPESAFEKPKVICLFGNTLDNQESVLSEGARLWLNGTVTTIGVLHHEDLNHGYPGFTAWRNNLLGRGVPSDAIDKVIIPVHIKPNTLTEAEAFVRYAKENNWKNIYIASGQLLQFRAFISMVSVIRREHQELYIYNQRCEVLDWTKGVVHSQGILRGVRRDIIDVEWQKINKYYDKGDLVGLGEVLRYLDERDKSSYSRSNRD